MRNPYQVRLTKPPMTGGSRCRRGGDRERVEDGQAVGIARDGLAVDNARARRQRGPSDQLDSSDAVRSMQIVMRRLRLSARPAKSHEYVEP